MSIIEKIKNILVMLMLQLLWVSGIVIFFRWFLDQPDPTPQYYNVPVYLLFACILAPLFEELFFRVIPLETHKLITQNSSETVKSKSLLLTVLLSSFLFGWAHGITFHSLLVQGVGGLCLSYVYIKNGYSYWSSVTLHALWNLICMVHTF